MLYETPEELPLDMAAPKNHLKTLIRKAMREGRALLSEEESKKFLATYRISSATPYIAKSAKDAARIASEIGYPVAIKISSPDIVHKSDVGGVMLNISSPDEVKKAFGEMIENVRKHKADAEIEGVSVQKVITDYDYEFILNSRKDPIFGPVIMFGLGGKAGEFFKDIAVGIPPLNQALARRLLEQTKIYKALSEGFRTKPSVNLPLLEEVLVKFSNLIADFPEIREFDIDPLIISNETAIAVGAKIALDIKAVKEGAQEHSHLIITPYPTRYIQPWECKDGRSVLLRPIRPEDEPLERELIADNLSDESMRFRFYHVIREMSHGMLTRFCNVDYEREIAIIAEYTSNGRRRNVGEGRVVIQPNGETGEFAIVVAEDFQGTGLGLKLSDTLIGIATDRGLRSVYGSISNDNKKIIGLAKRLGFTIERLSPEESKITLEL
jgi:acetyltransferase